MDVTEGAKSLVLIVYLIWGKAGIIVSGVCIS